MILHSLIPSAAAVLSGIGVGKHGEKGYSSRCRTLLARAAGMLTVWGMCLLGCDAQQVQPAASLRPDLQEVVKLSQADMGDDVIVSYVRHSGKAYPLNANEMIALKAQGISQAVISAMLEAKAAAPAAVSVPNPPAPVLNSPPAPAAPAPAPGPGPGSGTGLPAAPPGGPVASPAGAPGPETPVSLEYFHAQLASYGNWVEVPGYGACWSPTRVIAATPGGDWRPYYDNGHWVYTENGWFWVSDYAWGDIPFHYGRWIREPGYGWLWVPDLIWGPAWVSWRHAETDGYVGWAPLPYGAVWVDGGWHYRGRAVVEVGFDFGLGEDCYVFVGSDHFHDHYFRYRSRPDYPFHVHREVVHGFYGRTVLRNEFRRDEHGRFVNEGIGRERIERMTGRTVTVARFEERRPAIRADHEAKASPSRSTTAPSTSEASKVYRPPATASKPATQVRAASAPAATPKPTKK